VGDAPSSLVVEPGAVTPFAVMHDTDGRVTMVLERSVLDGGAINAHPLHNEATTSIAPEDLVRFLEACDHPPRLLSPEG
jgi:Ala-tRNA(Pro) deacylase